MCDLILEVGIRVGFGNLLSVLVQEDQVTGESLFGGIWVLLAPSLHTAAPAGVCISSCDTQQTIGATTALVFTASAPESIEVLQLQNCTSTCNTILSV